MIIQNLIKTSVSYPWRVIGVTAFLTIGFSCLIPRIILNLDGRFLLNSETAVSQADTWARDRFGLQDTVLIGIWNSDGIYNEESLQRLLRITRGLQSLEAIAPDSVVSLATVIRLLGDETELNPEPLVSDKSPEGFEPETIRRDSAALGLENGILVSSDGKGAVVYAEVGTGADRYILLQEIQALARREGNGKDEIYISGTALAQAALGMASARDLILLAPLVALVIGLVMFVFFADPRPSVVALSEIGVSLLISLGILGLFEKSVFISTLIVPVILIAVGVSDDVYALTQIYRERRKSPRQPDHVVIVRALLEVAPRIRLTAILSIAGLLAFTLTDLEPIRVFGIFGALAIFLSSLCTFTLVPALLLLLGPGGRPGRHHSHFTLPEWIYRLSDYPFRKIALGTVLVASAAGVLATQMRINDNWINNLPASNDVFRGDHKMNRMMAGTTALHLAVEVGRSHDFWQVDAVRSLGELEETLAALPVVGAVQSVYTDLLRVNAAMGGVGYDRLRHSAQEGSESLGVREVEEGYLLLSSVPELQLDKWLDSEGRWARVTVFIRSADYEKIGKVLRAVRAFQERTETVPFQIHPFGDGWLSYVTVELLVKDQVLSILAATLIDILLLAILLGSIRIAAIGVAPVLLSMLMIFALLGLSGVSLGIANSLFTAVALGIGLDFSAHLVSKYQTGLRQGLNASEALRQSLLATAPTIVTSALAISSGFAVLTLSAVRPNMQLGATISLTMLLCAANTLIFVPCFLKAPFEAFIVKPKAGFRHAEEHHTVV